jgi:glycosyltransferase 2 family protein
LKKKLVSSIKFILFVAIGGFLLWLAFRGQDVSRVKTSIQNANYFWIILSLLLGLISHISRTIRWKMLIKPLGYNPRFINVFFAVFVGYFANLAFPRLGEVSKCGILKRYEDIPINKLLGTMIVERTLDLLSLFVFVVIIIFLEFDKLHSFFMEKILKNMILDKFENSGMAIVLFLVSILILVGIFILLYKRFKHKNFFMKVKNLVYGMWEGIKSIRMIKNKPLFIFHSVLIWSLYYLMTYVAMFSMKAIAGLGAVVGLAAFVFGSFGMAAPVQGGIGAYHELVSKTLQFYNVDSTDALGFATLMHGSQTFMIIIFGFLSLILLPIINNKVKHAK